MKHFKIMSRNVSAPITCLLALCAAPALGCRGGNAPGPQDDVVVHAPGAEVEADDQGVRVKAPLGIDVNVDKDAVTVKAPGVDVNVNAKGVSVDAPLVTVRTGEPDKQ